MEHPYNNQAIRQRQSSHSWYNAGMDHFNPSQPLSDNYLDYYDHPTDGGSNLWATEASQYVKDLNGGVNTISPWYVTNDQDRMGTFAAIREDNYNPFIGNEGAWVTPEGNDIRQSMGGSADGYRDDSISAYLKHAFSGKDQIKNRADALRNFRQWSNQVPNPDYQSNMDSSEKWMDGAGRYINPATTRMSQRHFDSLGLADYGLEYEGKAAAPAKFVPQDISGGWNPTGMMTGGARPLHSDDTGMMTGGARPAPDSTPANVGGGSFMAAYKAKRDELASKPSVMSLMTELKDA